MLDLLRQKDEPSWDENLYAFKQKDYHKALEKYWYALDLQVKIKDTQGIADTYLDIGTTYRQLKKNAEAEHY